MAGSSNSLTASTVWSEFWYDFSSDLILVILYLCSTDRRPPPPFSLCRYNKEVRLAGCLSPFSTMMFRAALSTYSDRGQCCVHIKYRRTGSGYWLVACTRLQSDRELDHIIDILRRCSLAAHARASRYYYYYYYYYYYHYYYYPRYYYKWYR